MMAENAKERDARDVGELMFDFAEEEEQTTDIVGVDAAEDSTFSL